MERTPANRRSPRRAWLIVIAVFCLPFGLVHFVASAAGALSRPLAVAARDSFVSRLDPDRRKAYDERFGQQASDWQVYEEFWIECLFRLPVKRYTETPLWRRLRTTMAVRCIASLALLVSAVMAIAGRELGRRGLVVTALVLGVVGAIEALTLQRELPLLLSDFSRDHAVAHRELAAEIERPQFSDPINTPDAPDAGAMTLIATVYFLLVSWPWQMAALGASGARQRLRAEAGSPAEADGSEESPVQDGGDGDA